MRVSTPGRAVRALVVVALVSAGLAAGGTSRAADTGNAAPQTDRIVSADPASFTPHVMDGAVFSMTRVGDQIVVGGEFTRVRNAGSTTDIPRRNLFAFNAFTGQVSPTFAPNPNGTVYAVEPGADQASVYVAGGFTSATSGGATVAVSRLYKASLVTGDRITQFNAGSYNGQVRDVSLTGNRLWIAGKFTHVHGVSRRAFAALNATTGARDEYSTLDFAGAHLAGSVTNVQKIATSPDNSQLVAIGNFDTVNGVRRHQFAMIDIDGASAQLANYYTTQFESPCSASFETYMTDVNYSPDGDWFAISTTGAFGGTSASMAGTSGCDVVARFESGASGTNVRPTWTAYTGGDTTWSVEVTDDVVYTGGHQRWQNNPSRGDVAGQGAVSRPGIAALSAQNGMPYSWNPTRTLGAGVRAMIATEEGLFIGSDTDVIAGETHRKVAFMPLAGGVTLPPARDYAIPADIYTVAAGGTQLVRRTFDGTQATASSNAPNGTGWGSTVGAFMVNGVLYTANSNGTLTRRTFNGTTYGAATNVNGADLLVNQSDWHSGDVPQLTSLFYHRGWIYFTKSFSNQLFRRAFEPESGVVGQQRFAVNAVSGISYLTMRGAFVAGGRFYFANATGSLNVASWSDAGPVAGTTVTLGSAGGGWASRAMFPYQGPPLAALQPPTASFTLDCDQLTCSFDARGSTDSDGSITDYHWSFGDGQETSGTSSTATHTYAGSGAFTVTLTVTDDDGQTDTAVRTANPTSSTDPLALVGSAATTGNRTSHRVTIPAAVQAGDLLVVFLAANTTATTYSTPAGWTQIESVAGDGTVGLAYSRLAAAGDAGGSMTVTSGGFAKDVMTIAAYRGAADASPITDSAVALQTSSTTAHVTPGVTAVDGDDWLVSFWADKSSATTGWALPAGVTQRATATGTGSGHISAVLADSDGPVPSGPAGGLTATADSAGTSSVTFSVLVSAG